MFLRFMFRTPWMVLFGMLYIAVGLAYCWSRAVMGSLTPRSDWELTSAWWKKMSQERDYFVYIYTPKKIQKVLFVEGCVEYIYSIMISNPQNDRAAIHHYFNRILMFYSILLDMAMYIIYVYIIVHIYIWHTFRSIQTKT